MVPARHLPDTFLSALTAANPPNVARFDLFGIALALVGDKGAKIFDALNQLSLVMFRLVAIIMAVAPIGASGQWPSHRQIWHRQLTNLAPGRDLLLTALLFVLVVLGAVARLAGFRSSS